MKGDLHTFVDTNGTKRTIRLPSVEEEPWSEEDDKVFSGIKGYSFEDWAGDECYHKQSDDPQEDCGCYQRWLDWLESTELTEKEKNVLTKSNG